MPIIVFNEKLLDDLSIDARKFLGEVIDISDAPVTFLYGKEVVELATLVGLTVKQLAVQRVEDLIRKLVFGQNIEIICIFKEQFESFPELEAILGANRILLLK